MKPLSCLHGTRGTPESPPNPGRFILLVEDNPGDLCLTREALKDARVHNHLSVVRNGEEAIQFLRRTGNYADVLQLDLVPLDLNIPKLDGHVVLAIVKEDRT